MHSYLYLNYPKISYLKRYMYSFLFGMDENYSLRFDLS